MPSRNRKAPPKNTSPDPVLQYALDVRDGKEIAGPFVRLACERHLRDLEQGEERGIWWDLPAAERIIGYFRDVLRLAGGEHEGKPFLLHSSQQFILGSLFGWKGADGFRRFRVAYIEQGKGSGKSPLAAGVGLYMLTADSEPRAEIYSAAVDKDQAQILFRDAVAMVDQSQTLDAHITRSGGPGKEWNLAYLKNGSFFRPISSEHTGGRGKSGPRPHCVLLDEVHEHPSSSMVEFMRKGTKGRRQALILMITNAGAFNPTAVCWNYHEYADRVLNGRQEDDGFFPYVCALDKSDQWQDPACWRKTNPLLGISIPSKYLEEQVREATGMPSKQSLVRRLNFCEWVDAADPFVEPAVWDANGASVPAEQLRKQKCFGGLDLSGKNDLTALVLVFVLDDGTKAVLPFFWTPKDTLREREERDRAPYQKWVEDGFLSATPGRSIDYAFVARQIADLAALYEIEAIAFDKYRIDDLERELSEINCEVKLVKHGQGFIDMNPAIEALEDDLLEGRLRHGSHPVLTWCISNTQVIKDATENRRFDKRKATGRIDGTTALAMSDNLSVSHKPEPEKSYQLMFV